MNLSPDQYIYATERLAAIRQLIRDPAQDLRDLKFESDILRQALSLPIKYPEPKPAAIKTPKPVAADRGDVTYSVFIATDIATGFTHLTSSVYPIERALSHLPHDPAKTVTLTMANEDAARGLSGAFHKRFAADRVPHPTNSRYFYPKAMRGKFIAIVAFAGETIDITKRAGPIADHGLRFSPVNIPNWSDLYRSDRWEAIFEDYEAMVY